MRGGDSVQITRGYAYRRAYAADVVGNLATITPIDLSEYVLGSIFIPAGSPITTVTFYVAERRQTDPDQLTNPSLVQPALIYIQQRSASNVNTSLTVAAGFAYPIPPEVFGAGSLKIVVNSAGSLGLTLKG